MTTHTGGCACGAIRYSISADPLMAGHCQCRACQQFTGTGHANLMGFPKDALSLTGEPRYFAGTADSGNAVERGFCAECGSPVISHTSGFPGMVAIQATSLDDPSIFEPQFVLFTAAGQPWDMTDPELPHFAGMAPVEGM